MTDPLHSTHAAPSTAMTEKSDHWTTSKLIVLAFVTLGCAFTFLYIVSG